MKLITAIKEWHHRNDAEEIKRLRKELEVQKELARRAEHLAMTAMQGYFKAKKALDELLSAFPHNGMQN